MRLTSCMRACGCLASHWRASRTGHDTRFPGRTYSSVLSPLQAPRHFTALANRMYLDVSSSERH